MNALRQGLLQDRCDRYRIIGGEQDAIDTTRNVIVDKLDLLVDLGLGASVSGYLDVADLLGSILHALGGRVEVADADQLRHIHQRDRLAGLVGRAGGLAAVIRFGRRGGCRPGVARERAGWKIIAAIPLVGGHGGAARHRHAQHHERGRLHHPMFHALLHYGFLPKAPLFCGLSPHQPATSRRPWRELAISVDAIRTAPMTMMVASPLTPVNASPFFNSWIMTRPTTVPQIVPTPPKMLVPPRTTAAMTSSS